MRNVLSMMSALVVGGVVIAGAEPVGLRHVADVSVPIKAAVEWIDCTPQHCVVPDDVRPWDPYRIRGPYVDAGIGSDWLTDDNAIVLMGTPGDAVMTTLNTPALAMLPTAAEGDFPDGNGLLVFFRDRQYLHTGDYGQWVSFIMSADGRLLVAAVEVHYVGVTSIIFAGSDYDDPATPEDECRVQAAIEAADGGAMFCPGDTLPAPPANIPVINPPIEFTLWEVHVNKQVGTNN